MQHSGNTNNKKHYLYATSWISHLVC